MIRTENKSQPILLMFTAISCLFLSGLLSSEIQAQDESEQCPCFNDEEVKAVFRIGEQIITEMGMFECGAEDYSVEFSAEVVAWDQDFEVVAQAKVKWMDIDPSQCIYIDTTAEPGLKRDVSSPAPAPEAASRACLKIIKAAIAELDEFGDCFVYP